MGQYEQQPGQNLPAPQQQGMGPQDDMGYSYPGDMWAGRQSNDTALQVRNALYDSVPIANSEESFEEWVTSRTLMLTRASRIPGIDKKEYRRLVRSFMDLVDTAHSQGHSKILKAECESFQFELELLVSTGETPIQGITGITAMTTTATNMKQEIRMPQQPATQSFLSTLNPFAKRGGP